MADLMAALSTVEVQIAGAVGLEQGLPELGADGPVGRQGVDVGDGDAALQVAGDVLQVLGGLAVDVARQVEVEVVPLDLLDADHARIARDFEPAGEDVHDLVDVLGAQAVLGAVLHEAAAGVDHEDALAGVGVRACR